MFSKNIKIIYVFFFIVMVMGERGEGWGAHPSVSRMYLLSSLRIKRRPPISLLGAVFTLSSFF